MNRFMKSAAFPILIVILLVFVAQRLVSSGDDGPPAPPFPAIIEMIENGEVSAATVKVQEQKLTVTTAQGDITTGYPDEYGQELTQTLTGAGVDFQVKGISGSPWWSSLILLAPFILFLVFWIYLMNRMQGGGSKVMSFGKSKACLLYTSPSPRD